MESNRPFIIAIDGYSSCGKSTVSKQLAKKLNFAYIDTGAMYRAVTLYFLDNKVTIENEGQIKQAVQNISIHFEVVNGENNTFLNLKNVENEIRTLRISSFVSEVSALVDVRNALVPLQRKAAEKHSVVMDGRDIGTVVFPYADVKLFLTSTLEARASRRYQELINKGSNVTIEEVLDNLKHRDHIDTTRSESPLKMAEDAILIDNTNLTIDEQFEKILKIIYSNISL